MRVCFVKLMFTNPIRKTIRHEIQDDVVFEERFRAGEDKGKSLRCIESVLRRLGLASRKTLEPV